MQSEFFQRQVEKLRGVYSPGSFNEVRVAGLWERFKDVPNHVFESAITYLINEHTSQTLPAMSKFAEAVGFFKTSADVGMNVLPNPFDCAACRDHGFGFVGDIVTQCTCAAGRKVSPEKLVREQKNYDIGKRLFPRPRDLFRNPGRSLPDESA